MKLAFRKEPAAIPMNYHYFLHIMPITCDTEAAIYETIGYVVIEVEDTKANRLLEASRAALNHQVEIAYIVEKELQK